jgi:hypothetical protein
VVNWFDDLNLLRGVPFNYLVPDERMLPAESIRFFWLDAVWVDALLDGAFSIGRVTSSDHSSGDTFTDSVGAGGYDKVTGILLRSSVVAGWPDLQVDGFGADGTLLERLRMDRLSPNVLICLFKGEVGSVAVHGKPETLHFGLDLPDAQHADLFKKLRDAAHDFEENDALTVDTITWRDQPRRILDVNALAAAIQSELSLPSVTSAQFALQVVEGVEEVRFYKQGVAPS